MKEGKNFINKNKYDDIKRMDRRQMNEYINGVKSNMRRGMQQE